jgi:hypothetical protein
MSTALMTKITTPENSFISFEETSRYGIKKGQIWKSVGFPNYYGDLKVLYVQRRSKEALIFVIDEANDTVRSINAYNLARTGNFRLVTSKH